MDPNDDPYWKLRPESRTPDDELCSCANSPAIMLQPRLRSNPLSCIACNLEVPPQRVGFSEALAERLAFWRSFHESFYYLWLDSGEFEDWAKAQLEDPESPVNRRGLELVSQLNTHRRTYYWWFQYDGQEDFEPRSRCPNCDSELARQDWVHVCEQCSIVVVD